MYKIIYIEIFNIYILKVSKSLKYKYLINNNKMKKVRVFRILIRGWKISKKLNKTKKTTDIVLYNIKTFKYTLIIRLLNNFKLFFND